MHFYKHLVGVHLEYGVSLSIFSKAEAHTFSRPLLFYWELLLFVCNNWRRRVLNPAIVCRSSRFNGVCFSCSTVWRRCSINAASSVPLGENEEIFQKCSYHTSQTGGVWRDVQYCSSLFVFEAGIQRTSYYIFF